MIPPRVIPVLQIHRGTLVKTTIFAHPRYLGDPINAVKIYNDKQVDELFIVDIGAARGEYVPDLAMLTEIASEAFMPVGYGGGVNSVGIARQIVNLGVEKVVVGTALIQEPLQVQAMAAALGSQSVVASIDYRGSDLECAMAVTGGGRKTTGISPVELARRAVALGVGEILLTAVDREGLGVGYDLGTLQQVCAAVDVSVIALGGATGTDDFRRALASGASAVAAGSRFVFYGRLNAVLVRYLDPSIVETLP